jgi:transcriptional regulator with XRE-family HTH domain
MEVNHPVVGSGRPDPEVEAGQALRRLRLARNWSQEEVAVRMTAYGYDFHQTMIAKIEAAQRPLRVRELADFAALYGVDVQDLFYPPTASVAETDREIGEAEARLEMLQAQAAAARNELDVAREAMRRAEAAYQAAASEIAVIEGRLTTLRADKEKLLSWESKEISPLPERCDQEQRKELKSTIDSIASARGGPAVLRIRLGHRLRRLREEAGITMEDASYAIRASASKISRLETGRQGLKERDVFDLLALYGVTDEGERQALRALTRQANSVPWWQDYSDVLPSWFEPYIGLEEAAAQIQIYDVQFVPSLLQTEDYAHAVTRLDHNGGSTREIERTIQLRMARQTILDRSDPPDLRVILDEAVLRRPVGGAVVMDNQLKHLAEMADRSNVAIQVLPFQASGPSAAGAFSVLRFADPDLEDLVYLEQLNGAYYLTGADELDGYLRAMQRLGTQALPLDKTRQMLRKLHN